MAEDHRRVGPRAIVSGSGMAADPDKIDQLQRSAESYARTYRPRPEKSFGEVLRLSRAKEAAPTAEELEAIEEERREAEKERKKLRKMIGGGTNAPGHTHDDSFVILKG